MKANSARTGITKRKSSGGVVDTIKTVVYAILIALVVRTAAVLGADILSLTRARRRDGV